VYSLENKKLKLFQFLTILFACLLTTTLFVTAQSGSLTAQTIAAGPYAGAPTYSAFISGTTYYVKNAYGAIAYSGTDWATVFQDVLDVCEHGDSVYIKNGQYEFSTTVTWTTAGVRVYGEQFGIGTLAASGTTFVMPSGTVLDPMLDVTASCFYLENIYFYNEGYALAYDGVPLQISRSDTWMSVVRNIQTRGFDIGLLLQSDDGAIDHVHFYNLDLGPSETANLKIYRTNYYIADCSFHTLRSDATTKKADYGVYVDSADTNTVALIRFYDTTIAATDTTGVYMDNSWYVKAVDMHFDGTFTTHMELTSACYYNDFSALSFITGAPIIVDAGAYNSYQMARGYFENYVTAIVSAGEYVAHGLAGTPNRMMVSCNLPVYGGVAVVASTAAYNATHVQIYVYWVNGTAISADAITVTLYASYTP
jgi:hypothetical protein